MCYLFKVILFFKLFSYSSVCVGAKPCEKDKLGVGGSPIAEMQGYPSSRFRANFKFWTD